MQGSIVANSPFFMQADLLGQVIPFVNTEACFALKGGTAINSFGAFSE
jgi:hypothetical protein